MNCSLASISRTIGTEISFSCSESFKFLKKSCASFMESEEISKIFRPLEVGPRAPLRSDLGDALKNTFKASGRSRAPWQASQGSPPIKYFEPRPLHSGQAPYGDLKENNL